MEAENKDMLLKCFCEARKTQAFFTKCLDENSSKEEKDFHIDLIKDTSSISKKVVDFCKIYVG